MNNLIAVFDNNLAFSKAPKNEDDVKKIFELFNADIIIDLTVTEEKRQYYDYSHFLKDKDIKYYNFMISEENGLKSKKRVVHLSKLISKLTTLQTQNKKILIHDLLSENRAPMIFGCLMSNIDRDRSFTDILFKIKTKYWTLGNKIDSLFSDDNYKRFLELYCTLSNKNSLYVDDNNVRKCIREHPKILSGHIQLSSSYRHET